MRHSDDRLHDNRIIRLPAGASQPVAMSVRSGLSPIWQGRSPSPRLEVERPYAVGHAGFPRSRLTRQYHEFCICGEILKVTPLKSALLCGMITCVRCTITRTLTSPNTTYSGASSVRIWDCFISHITVAGWPCARADDNSRLCWLEPVSLSDETQLCTLQDVWGFGYPEVTEQ